MRVGCVRGCTIVCLARRSRPVVDVSDLPYRVVAVRGSVVWAQRGVCVYRVVADLGCVHTCASGGRVLVTGSRFVVNAGTVRWGCVRRYRGQWVVPRVVLFDILLAGRSVQFILCMITKFYVNLMIPCTNHFDLLTFHHVH